MLLYFEGRNFGKTALAAEGNFDRENFTEGNEGNEEEFLTTDKHGFARIGC